MANYSTTYSGDFTSFVAGKLFNAAGMAKQEKERREQEKLDKAAPGSLFARALQHEFGGDLYNRTLGAFDPRKSFDETNRKSSKENRFTAQFPKGEKKTSKGSPKVEKASQELLSDDDKESIPVKDKDLREFVSKVFGAGIDAKLVRSEGRISNLSSQVVSVKQSLSDTQSLILNQNEILEAKFDQILQIFDKQSEYQTKIKDEAEIRRRESELEQKKDRSKTRAFEETTSGDASSSLFGRLLSYAARRALKGKIGQKITDVAKKLLEKVLGSGGGIRSALSRAAGRGISGSLDKRAGRAGKAKVQELLARRIANAATSKPVGRTKKLTNLGRKRTAAADALKADRIFRKKSSDAAERGLALLAGPEGEKIITNIGKMDKLPASQKNAAFDAMIRGRGASQKISDRVIDKAGAKIAGKIGTKGVSKTLAKGLGKVLPFAGTAIALGDAALRFKEGDKVGAALSLGSAIPILGWGFTAIDIARDMGAFGGAPPYERGTGLTEEGPAILHGTEAIIGRSDRSDAINSYKRSMREIGSSLLSASISLGESSGVGAEVRSEIKKSGLDYEIARLPLSSDLGKISKLTALGSVTTKIEQEEKIRPITERDRERKRKREGEEEDPAPSNKKLEDFPEYDIEHNEPNSVVRMGNKLYRTNNLGGLEEEITLDEANRIDAASRSPRPRTTSPGANGSYASGTWIGPPGDNDGEQTGLNMNLPGGIGTPIYAPVDLVYKSRGTDGNPSVGLQGTSDALGPQGRGFGYYGAYYFQKDGREYEVLMGHFRDLPYRGSKEGEKIPKGTLIGYQGASGRSVSSSGGVYPHISLHVNAVDVSKGRAGNDVLRWFADGLAGGNISTGNGGGGGGERISRPERALLKTIAFAEGTTQSYGTIFGGKVIPELERGEMTVREVYNMMMTGQVRGRNAGYARGSYATGRYQFMPDTIKDIVEKYGTLRWGEKFTKEAQDRAILSRIANFRGVTRSLLEAQGLSNDVLDMLSGEFASFPTYEGVSAYNQPVKSQAKLRQMYKQFLGSIKVGPKIVGPKIVGPGKVGAGIPLVPDLTVQKMFDAIRKGISDGLDQSRDTFNKGLIPTRNVKPNQLQSNSAIMEDMEEETMVAQQVFIINQETISSQPLIISRGNESDAKNFSNDYLMAVLGA